MIKLRGIFLVYVNTWWEEAKMEQDLNAQKPEEIGSTGNCLNIGKHHKGDWTVKQVVQRGGSL